MNLSIDNVINISVSQPGQGVGKYNTSNLAIFTDETYQNTFGVLGYKIYLGPNEVATDFGTDSKTFKLANAIFSQQPNILTGDGYLVVLPTTAESQKLTFGATPTSGTFVFNYGGHASAAINWNDTASQVQTKLRAMEGLETIVVTGVINSGTGITIQYKGVDGSIAISTITSNTLSNGSPVTVTPSELIDGETLGEAVTRTSELIEYFGILTTSILDEDDTLASAAIIQPLSKIAFLPQNDPVSVDDGGIIKQLQEGSFTHSRGLFYGHADSADQSDAELATLVMAASYAGRNLSTNFDGSETTQTAQLKDLIGVLPDPSMNETLKNLCKDAGADIYASIQGIPKTLCFGANEFFDDVYNLLWFVGALKVAGFNVLATVGSKIPQTEAGMSTLKNAYRQVAEQSITNGFLSPGKWTSPTTFGNQNDLYANIAERGYYIYSQPVSQQSAVSREAREAPLVQIAIKYAGAIHTSDVIVNINK